MAKNRTIDTRTSRMAYCSKSPLPDSANWINRFQSISCASSRLEITYPSVRAIEPAMREPRMDPQSTGFRAYLVTQELHDAHGVGRPAVISQDEFGDPQIAPAKDSLDSKPLFAWLTSALVLYIASTAE